MKLRPVEKEAEPERFQTLVFDVETDGFLREMTKIHCLVITEVETNRRWVFRKNRKMDTISQGVEMLMNANMVVGHNVMQFDLKAIKKIFPWFELSGKIRDTLIMCRLIFANVKEKDFRLFAAGKLPGNLIGAQGLEAWGYRLGLQKGTYQKDMEDQGLDPWSAWNVPMEEYCELDVDVNSLLFDKLLKEGFTSESILFEHQIHDLMILQHDAGIHFDEEAAELLADAIEAESAQLQEAAIEHFGNWYAPAKKKIVRMLWNDEAGINAKKTYELPDYELGEDKKRAVWGAVTWPKKTTRYKDKAWHIEGAPFVAIVKKEFKPTSRHQIIDRFTMVYGWTPTDFTEKGNPEVSDDVLRALIGHIPMAEELAEVFYMEKRLGQIKTGKNAWLKLSIEGKIHHTVHVGGTVSGRCSHANPNLGQVPRVVTKKVVDPKTGEKKTVILKGREGKHGWDCRRLFYVPEEWGVLVGCDLSGVELRCLANATWEFDGGYLADIILNGDIHEVNREKAGLDNRDLAKTFIYALIYGAGDEKIGSIVAPLADPDTQRELGKNLRLRFLNGMPGLKKAIKQFQRQAKRGFLIGRDGRKLFVRGQHSAPNLALQHDGAMIAKLWVLLVFAAFEDEGWTHGWDGDFVNQLFVHDEIQIAVRHQHVERAKEIMKECAKQAGLIWGFKVPIDAEAKHGENWSETH